MLYAVLVLGAGILIEVCAVMRAPVGYQDDKGFHVGSKRRDDHDTRVWTNPS